MSSRPQLLRNFAIILPAVALLFLVAVLQAAARKGLSKERSGEAVYGALAKVPAKAISRRNPLEGDPDAIAAGGNLFEEHCAECHGQTAEGGKRGPTLRVPKVRQATPGAIFWILSNGVVRRGMPDWSKLPEPERWQLVTFVKSLGRSPAP